jgi:hypothetical protein
MPDNDGASFRMAAGRKVYDDRHRRNSRLRAAFITGAEEDSLRRLGRGLTLEELRRVLRHYPGDLPSE